MKLLLIRHGIAEKIEDWAKTAHADDLRPLTEDGRKKMRATAAGLSKGIAGIELIAHSPLVRAVETAHLLSKAMPTVPLREVKLLGDSNKAVEWMKWLATEKKLSFVAIVGHEPDLSQFIGYALTGRARSVVEMKKASACLIEFGGKREPSGAVLKWLVTSKQLRASTSRPTAKK